MNRTPARLLSLSLVLFHWSIIIPVIAAEGVPNRLLTAQSPYLQQHAYNPVDWFPWGDEAFEKAKAENKPVLLSIGYSTCHWCHVMNRESFSDPGIAAFLNEHFVCIKVDREERPDVDRVYMNFVQRLTGSGGWPLNVFLTPDRKPFFGGTYFPPDTRPGSRTPGMKGLTQRIHELWTEDAEKLIAQSDEMTARLNRRTAAQESTESKNLPDLALFARVVEALSASFDNTKGGFGGAPKFPMPTNISFLLAATSIPDLPEAVRQRAGKMAVDTLQHIGRGGIRDHVGGGFHRYTVDGEWQLPHFEKMLYDQALLISAYTDAWRVTKDPFFKNAAVETIEYLLRDMQSPDGAFFSAEDAESYETEDAEMKREGAFYLWSAAQLDALFPEQTDAVLARTFFDIHEEGNVPPGPHEEELDGWNILRIAAPIKHVAAKLSLELDDALERMVKIKRVLFAKREKRPRPFLDDKIIVAWNGLAISALSRAALAFGEPRYAAEAKRAAEFLRANLADPEAHTLKRLFRIQPSEVDAFSEDYAYFIGGLLDLYEATGNVGWIEWAAALQDTHLAKFFDPDTGGFFATVENEELVFDRQKDSYDGVTPASSSVATKNLARLGLILGNDDYRAAARQTLAAFLPAIEQAPNRMPALVSAMAFVIRKPVQLVIASSDGNHDLTNPIVRTYGKMLLPNAMLLHADGAEGQSFLARRLEFLATMAPVDDQPTAYLCHDFVCQLPTNSPEVLRAQLGEMLPIAGKK